MFPSSTDDWRAIEKGFRDKWNFPHCIGALDGKHIVMQACGSGSYFYNYKGTHSVVLMVLAGMVYISIFFLAQTKTLEIDRYFTCNTVGILFSRRNILYFVFGELFSSDQKS